jgi:hypothetical protein
LSSADTTAEHVTVEIEDLPEEEIQWDGRRRSRIKYTSPQLVAHRPGGDARGRAARLR